MKLSIPEHISKLRKDHSLTQEQLAEALGVTFAAVSKWERGAAAPSLANIVEMADLFGVSVDALIGFEFRGNDRKTTVERLKHHINNRNTDTAHTNTDEAVMDAEKALQRFPNCFDVVYHCAQLYRLRGIDLENPDYHTRALSLYQHACRLIDQNSDPTISELALHRKIAEMYISLGAHEKGLKILKQHNPCEINHAMIGYTLAAECKRSEEARPYLSAALLQLLVKQVQIVMGYMNIYEATKDYPSAIALLEWALSIYPGLKTPGTLSFLEKSEATTRCLLGGIHQKMNDEEAAEQCLRQALAAAKAFDEAPNYDVNSLRFVTCDQAAAFHDNMGETAAAAVEKVVRELDDPAYLRLWQRLQET